MLTIQELRTFAHDSLYQGGGTTYTPYFGSSRNTYIDNSWNTYHRPLYYHSTGSSHSSKESEKEKNNQSHMILGIIALGVGIFGSAASIASLKNRYDNLSTTSQMAKRFEEEHFEELTPEATKIFKDLIEAKKRVDQGRVNEIKLRALPISGIGVAGTLLGVGGYQDMSQLVTAGQATLLASTLIGLGVMGYQFFRESSQVEQQKVRHLAREFLQATDISYPARLGSAARAFFSSLAR